MNRTFGALTVVVLSLLLPAGILAQDEKSEQLRKRAQELEKMEQQLRQQHQKLERAKDELHKAMQEHHQRNAQPEPRVERQEGPGPAPGIERLANALRETNARLDRLEKQLKESKGGGRNQGGPQAELMKALPMLLQKIDGKDLQRFMKAVIPVLERLNKGLPELEKGFQQFQKFGKDGGALGDKLRLLVDRFPDRSGPGWQTKDEMFAPLRDHLKNLGRGGDDCPVLKFLKSGRGPQKFIKKLRGRGGRDEGGCPNCDKGGKGKMRVEKRIERREFRSRGDGPRRFFKYDDDDEDGDDDEDEDDEDEDDDDDERESRGSRHHNMWGRVF